MKNALNISNQQKYILMRNYVNYPAIKLRKKR